jgi:hypothetical protein
MCLAGQTCREPTVRRAIELLEGVLRHEPAWSSGRPTVMVTQLTPSQRKILKLLGLSPDSYGH